MKTNRILLILFPLIFLYPTLMAQDDQPGDTTNCQAFYFYSIDQNNDDPDVITFQFEDNSYSDIIQYEWDFGDGTYSEQMNPAHTFPHNGEMYEVCLTITTQSGCTNSFCNYILAGYDTIPVDPPQECIAGFEVDISVADCINCYDFFDESIGDVIAWHWEFGDGQSGNEQNPMHMYAETGVYEVCLTIATADSCISTYCDLLEVGQNNPADCEAAFEYFIPDSVITIPEVFPVQFQDASIGEITERIWEFDDGTIANEPNPFKTFDIFNTPHTVCLHVATEDGCQSTFCDEIFLPGDTFPPNECNAKFEYVIMETAPPIFGFEDVSQGENIVAWHWDFGDGTESDEPNPEHVYEYNDDTQGYEVCLTITTENGCQSTYCEYVYPNGTPYDCEAKFWYERRPEMSDSPYCYEFFNESWGDIDTISWTINDEQINLGENGSLMHCFEEPGEYDVCLLITTESGCESSYCELIEVSDNPVGCEAGFYWIYAEDENGEPTNRIEFVDTSHGNVVEWNWAFGDGHFSNETLPSHTYEEFGEYEACLTISTENGCESTFCDIVHVGENPPPPPPADCHNLFINLVTSTVLGGNMCNGWASAQLIDRFGVPVETASYFWSNGSTEPEVGGLCPNTPYFVWIESHSGCQVWGTFALFDMGGAVYNNGLSAFWNMDNDGSTYYFNFPYQGDDLNIFWDFGNGEVVEGASIAHTFENGDNRVVALSITDEAGNVIYTEQFNLLDEHTSITEIEQSLDWKIYPNPVQDELNIKLATDSPKPVKIDIYNAAGLQLQNYMLKNSTELNHSGINVSNLPKGVYIVRITIDNQQLTGKFVK